MEICKSGIVVHCFLFHVVKYDKCFPLLFISRVKILWETQFLKIRWFPMVGKCSLISKLLLYWVLEWFPTWVSMVV